MKIEVRYGKSNVSVEVPDENLLAVCRLKPVPPLDDPVSRLEEALERPLSGPSLRQLAEGKSSACLVVCDKTRPVPNPLLLPPILRRLEEAGIPKDKTTILIATGTHRPNWGDELDELLGKEVAATYPVVNHQATDLDSHQDLGTTGTGMPVLLDQRYLMAELKIVLGLVEPHLMAGYSGGRKVLCPGLIAMPCMRVFHGPDFMDHPNSVTGVLEGNPCHLTAMEVADRVGCDFAVHVALDEHRRITGLFAGPLHQTFYQAVRLVDQVARAPVAEPADIIITSSAGYPLDLTFYQAIKGLVGVLPIVKPGTTILLAASLAEGLGSDHFRSVYQDFTNWEELRKLLWSPDYFRYDQWMVQEQMKVAEKADIWVYSEGVSPDDLVLVKVKPLTSLQEGLDQALKKHGAKAKVVVVPEGPYVMPTLSNGTKG
ncbi:MAG: nickel-dependent lactate racemase [Armatimonadetes bacterium]|nr:nickel-dependent lactate racemase [Armatimonadota bacterium]MDW8121353.1 nickel-dependent lactate racemase [Armatimonadota bacterium]